MSQNVFNPAVLVLYLWPTVSRVALFSLICNMRSWNTATLSCSALWFLSRPHPAPCCTAASFHTASRSIWWFRFFVFFSPALLSSLFFSLISYFLCGRRHLMFVLAPVVFGPRTEWAAMGGRKPDSPSWVHPNCLSPNPGLHLSCYISLHLHLQLFIPSLYLPCPLLLPDLRLLQYS